MSAPRLVYADSDGRIFDHAELGMAGSAAGSLQPLDERDCIPLPEGSELFLLPRRLPIGFDGDGRQEVLEKAPQGGDSVSAVAAFMAPAHTATLTAAYQTQSDAPPLPLFSYAALGFSRGKFVVAGLRVDSLPRQDPGRFPPQERITRAARRLLRDYPENRLWQQLGTCALTYCCPAARNLMLGRWEAPLPTSPACNASCLGCLSSQPQGRFPATQERLTFSPDAREVAEVALHHFARATDPLVSFGQGCEGEPLMNSDLLAESIHLIRRKEKLGTVNLNTNGSRPSVVTRLMREGLTSIRVSTNSLVPERHQAYYRPQGWSLEDALESIRVVKQAGGFASINLLTVPGVTDRPEEVAALYRLIEDTGLDLIQWRNLNLDPEAYLEELAMEPPAERMGIAELMAELKIRYPRLRHGYFNPVVTERKPPRRKTPAR